VFRVPQLCFPCKVVAAIGDRQPEWPATSPASTVPGFSSTARQP